MRFIVRVLCYCGEICNDNIICVYAIVNQKHRSGELQTLSNNEYIIVFYLLNHYVTLFGPQITYDIKWNVVWPLSSFAPHLASLAKVLYKM